MIGPKLSTVPSHALPVWAGMGIAALLMAWFVGPVRATEPLEPSRSASPTAADAKHEARMRARATELDAVRRSIVVSRKRQEILAIDIRKLENDRAQLSQDLIETARRLRGLESRIEIAEERLDRLHANEDGIRESLTQRKDILAEILSALQRMGRTPPPALLASPQDAVAAIRGSILAGAVLPGIRVEAEALAADLRELTTLRQRIDQEYQDLRQQYSSLGEERARISLLIETRTRHREESQAALLAERNKSVRLAGEAQSLQALIESMESGTPTAASAAAKAAQPIRHATKAQALAKLGDSSRMAPAVRFVDAKGLLPIPVAGSQILGFGEADGLGGKARGLSVETTPGSLVVSPCDGWVVYAGPFRSFGEVLILNAGDGYHVVLAGMERVDVALGQFVLTGEPVAVMGERRMASLGSADLTSATATLYVEFRKGGFAIDPKPWWDTRDNLEARG